MNVTPAQIATEFGFSTRHWTRQAAAGKVPGAYQPFEGGHWLFDLTVFRRWWETRQREVKEWQRYTGEVRHGGRAPSVRVSSTAEALKREIDEKLRTAFASG